MNSRENPLSRNGCGANNIALDPDLSAAADQSATSATDERLLSRDDDEVTDKSINSDGSSSLVNVYLRHKVNDSDRPVTVLIVGSGMAGLSCARYLSDHTNFDIVVVEANSERYGGRIWSYEVPNFPGKPVELGAMWLHEGMDFGHPLHRLAKFANLELMDHYAFDMDTIEIFDLLGKPYTNEAKKEFGKIKALLFEKMRTDRIKKQAPDISVDEAVKILSRKYPRLFQQNRVKFLEIPAIESYEGSTKDQLSLIFSEGVADNRTAKQYEYHGGDAIIPKGYRRLLDYLINTGRKFELHLGRKVVEIEYSDITSIDPSQNAKVIAVDPKLDEKHVYKVDHVVVAVPLGVLKADDILFDPPLSLAHRIAIENIGFGNMVKVLLVYDKVFWPPEKFFGCESFNPIGLPLITVNLHKIHQLPALLAMIASEGAVAADSMPETEIIARVVDHFKYMFGTKNVEDRKLIHTKVTRWRNDSLIGGAYSFGKIGMKSGDAENIRQPIRPHLFFAGEHTAMPENLHGMVHGAFVSGVRAAHEIMTERGLKIPEDRHNGATGSTVGQSILPKQLKTAAIFAHLIVIGIATHLLCGLGA